MDSKEHIARQDRAIESAESDVLERGPFVTKLAHTLVTPVHDDSGVLVSRKATGLVVGLTGEWGLGKSSVLNLLAKELSETQHVVVAKLNPWLFKGRDELIEAYFNSLRGAMGQNADEKFKSMVGALDRYKASIELAGTSVATVLDLFPGGGLVAKPIRWLLTVLGKVSKPKTLSADIERKSLETKLQQAKVAVVVLIDELDRVEDDEVRAVAQLVKAVGDIKGISYLVAYDPERVAQALGKGSNLSDKQRSGEGYLEKIIQYPIPLRPLLRDDVEKLLEQSLGLYGISMSSPVQPYQSEILSKLIEVVRTPREVKRITGAFSVLKEAVDGEICPYDVLAYSWVVTKSPSIRRLISERTDWLISDPTVTEMLRKQRWSKDNGSRKETLEDVLGEAASTHAGMLRLIFPRFDDTRSHTEASFDGDRLAKRRNLIRLLYLGNPPGELDRGEIERIWSLTQDELRTTLQDLQHQGQLGYLLDRIADFAPVLPKASEAVFWVEFSRVLVREHDWITGEEAERGYVEDATSTLWRIAKLTSNGKQRLQKIMEALIQAGDLLIAPSVLRKHLFEHGLTHGNRKGAGDAIFNARETEMLRDRELPRYRAAILTGIVLRKLPDSELIFCLLNCNFWDDDLRAEFTHQLDSAESITTLAALLTPPGFLCDRKTLEMMFDTMIVQNLTDRFVLQADRPESEWLAQAVNRFRAVMSGKDPHFASESFTKGLS